MPAKVIRSVNRMQAVARQLAAGGKRIGLVPTMGHLHDGHLALIRRAQKSADKVITSIFVNPLQFGPTEDLSRYPRTEREDIRKVKQIRGDIVFVPKSLDMYPATFQTSVTVDELTKTLEGSVRPHHFRGVTTVVAKLFNICRPDVVVFGLKDYQQAIVLRKMTTDLGYPIKFIILPTVREKDGVAMSSRNSYFSPTQRPQARCLYYALRTAKSLIASGTRDTSKIRREMQSVVRATSPKATIDYIAFTTFDSLTPVKEITRNTICSLAVTVHGVRLIDNMRLM